MKDSLRHNADLEGRKMPSKMRHGLLVSLVVVSLVVLWFAKDGNEGDVVEK
jgi:hypothetical protein